MKDKPAFPIPDPEWKDAMHRPVEISGLTRRELFAAMAMQGMLACEVERQPWLLMQDALRTADALIAELDKES